MPRTRAVSIEQTSASIGGLCWPLQQIEEVCAAAHTGGLVTHMDGARLFNAVVASGTSARAFAAHFDSLWIDLSKGLGAPIGAVLAGSRDFIEEAWRFKQRFGGAMRQAGIIAAGGVYALRHHVDRLAEDHERARRLASGLAEIPGLALDPERVETNIVIFDVSRTGLSGDDLCIPHAVEPWCALQRTRTHDGTSGYPSGYPAGRYRASAGSRTGRSCNVKGLVSRYCGRRTSFRASNPA